MPKREIGTKGAFTIFLLILALMSIGRLILKFDVSILLLFISIITTTIYVFYYGYSWKELFEEGTVPLVARATGAMLILLTVGPLISAWMISGTIPYMMYVGLKLLSPETFLLAAVIITSIASLLTGTSWGTAATFGVALMGVAYGLGVPLPIAAGAIVVGSYLGDKLSPISDTVILGAAVSEVDVMDDVKSILYTTIPAYILSLIVYAIVGRGYTGTIDWSKINEILNALSQNFHLSPITLIPPILVLYLSYKKYPTIPILWVGILSSMPLAIWQGYDVSEFVTALAKGPSISTGVRIVDQLLNRGGVTFMVTAMAIVFFAYIFAGQLEKTGTLRKIVDYLQKVFIKGKPGRLVFATSLTGIITAMATGVSYLSIMIPGITYKELYNKLGIKRTVLARTLADSGTVVVPLIPWAAAGIYMSTVLGVSTYEYLPWAIMCYAGFIIAWIYGFTGIAIWREEKR